MPSRPLRIGAVVAALLEEFPDLSISKVRFLESEGLVTPERTAAGYRQYSSADIDRLRWVLRAQRDHFWPLTTIRAALEDADRGLEPGGSGAVPDLPEESGPSDPDGLLARGPLRLSAPELAAAVGLTPSEVEELEEHGLLRGGAGGAYDEHDLRAARAAAGLARHGLEPRHLRTVRSAAQREVGLVEQASAGHRAGEADRREDLVRHVLDLHAALVRGGLDTAP